jgi:hypothetical protein
VNEAHGRGVLGLRILSGLVVRDTKQITEMIIGFVGCGKISAAVARGYAGADPAQRPQQVTK